MRAEELAETPTLENSFYIRSF